LGQGIKVNALPYRPGVNFCDGFGNLHISAARVETPDIFRVTEPFTYERSNPPGENIDPPGVGQLLVQSDQECPESAFLF
jgi:hypothetical protein